MRKLLHKDCPETDARTTSLDLVLLSILQGNDYLARVSGSPNMALVWEAYRQVADQVGGLVQTTPQLAICSEKLELVLSKATELGTNLEAEQRAQGKQNQSTAPCNNYQLGKCTRGSNCRFSHAQAASDNTPAQPLTDSNVITTEGSDSDVPKMVGGVSCPADAVSETGTAGGPPQLIQAVTSYWEGLLWVVAQYTETECPHYCWTADDVAPTIEELVAACRTSPDALRELQCPRSADQPLLPFEVCIALMPWSGRALVPSPLQQLFEEESAVGDMYGRER